MTRKPAIHTVLTLPRSVLSSLLTLAGLTAIITGILTMHVWMGGHGSTSHHAAAPPITTISAAVSGDTNPHALTEPGHAHEVGHHPARAGALAAVTVIDAAAPDTSSTASDTFCGGDCADEMMIGMCVLAMIVVSIAGLLTPSGRALLSTLGRRGPPALSWASRPAPTPSLTQLCISRT